LASRPPGISPLDGPPPSPVNGGMPSVSALAGPAPSGGMGSGVGGAGGGEAVQGILAMGQQLDQAVLALSQAIPVASAEFSQARELIKQGLAKFLTTASQMGPPSLTGGSFPGATSGKF